MTDDSEIVSKNWLILCDGKIDGPIPELVIRSRIDAGQIPPSAMFSCGNELGWINHLSFQNLRAPLIAGEASRPDNKADHQQEEAEAALAKVSPELIVSEREKSDSGFLAVPTAIAIVDSESAAWAGDIGDERPANKTISKATSEFISGTATLDSEPADTDLSAPVVPADPKETSSVVQEPTLEPAKSAGNGPPPIPRPQKAVETPVAPIAPAPGATRDRIVLLGRPASGKTAYLARLYERLWRSRDGIAAKAATGEVHRELMAICAAMNERRMIPNTTALSRITLDVSYHGQDYQLITLDYAGEIFNRVFVHDRVDEPHSRELLDHVDRAAAVLVLIDPGVVRSSRDTAATEEEFGLVQAINRIYRPGMPDVPVVVILTKYDKNAAFLEKVGGPALFMKNTFPALTRALTRREKSAVYQVSAVRSLGKTDVAVPLKYCLGVVQANEREVEKILQEQRIKRREHTQNVLLIITVSIVLLVGLIICLYVVAK